MTAAMLEPQRDTGLHGAEAQLARAGLYRDRGRFAESIVLHEDLASDPRCGVRQRARVELARDFRSAGLIDRAIACLDDALQSDAEDPVLLGELEALHTELRDWTAAIRTRRRMPRSSASARVLAHQWAALGRQTLDAGDADSARFGFETAIGISAQVADGYVGLGDVLERLGRGESAARLWDRALQLRRDVGAVVYPRIARVLEPARREGLLRAHARLGDRLAALWLTLMQLDGLPERDTGDSMAIWARLQRVPGALPLASELARRCAGPGHPGLAAEIRQLLQVQIDATRVRCGSCGASSPEPRWLCPICLQWEDTALPALY